MDHSFLLAIDQGTSATKSVIFDLHANLITKASVPLKSYFPQPGFVEQNPLEIYDSVIQSVKNCVQSFSDSDDIKNIITAGLSNQRETLILWNERGDPLYNAIVWQCKRSVEICQRLQESGLNNIINSKTGLIIDPYFSATKLTWLCENKKEIRDAVKSGKAYFGTVDTWLLYKLTKGEKYLTDYTNASRTLLFNIDDLKWDDELIDIFNLSGLNLPEARPSSFNFGASDFAGQFASPIPISALIGDSHAAAFGEGCFEPGTAKATLGTGSSILMNTGNKHPKSKNGMMSTICWSTSDRIDYALEGVIVSCGATINWLKDQLGLFADSKDTEAMAGSIKNNNGVYLIPAFSGLGAPHWKMDARAAIMGLTFGCNKNHIVRAALESIPYQIKDVVSLMEKDSEIQLTELNIDGGITSNQFVVQLLADLLKINIHNIGIEDVSALGAANMAGLEVGAFPDINYLKNLSVIKCKYHPSKNTSEIDTNYDEWLRNIKQLTTISS
jgi:glycerol kinase